jgi:ankyrin repeat protein
MPQSDIKRWGSVNIGLKSGESLSNMKSMQWSKMLESINPFKRNSTFKSKYKDTVSPNFFCTMAATEGKEEIEHKITHGADVNARGQSGFTPLHAAADRAEIIEVLIRHGADVNARQVHDEGTPLHVAANWRNVSVAELLITHGADVSARDMHGYTPLHLACSSSHNKEFTEHFISLLVSSGANLHAQCESGRTPLYNAYNKGNTELEEILRKYGATE